MKPNLAHNKPYPLSSIPFPVLASPKLDGVRALLSPEKGVLSRSLKPIPNLHIQAKLRPLLPFSLDGELVVGSPCSPSCMQTTVSGVMSIDGRPSFTYYVFDQHSRGDTPYSSWLRQLPSILPKEMAHLYSFVLPLEQRPVHTLESLLRYEEEVLSFGYEGLILRAPHSHYKFGRSTWKEFSSPRGGLLKLKRFTTSEATILAVLEALENTNVPTTSPLGLTQRPTFQEGLIPKDTLGSFLCSSPTWPAPFRVSPGHLTASQRLSLWRKRESLVGQTLTFKHFPIGEKVAPRFPAFVSFRPTSLEE